MSINNGGQAFPCEREYGEKLESSEGMTLRDYFAAKAMQAMISSVGAPCHPIDDRTYAESYKAADAMIRAREAS